MMKIISIIMLLFMVGCSQKHHHPIQLEEKAESNINIRLLDRKKTYVPKDKFFYSKSWHYKQNVYNSYQFFRNDEIADTFYLAHHATHIYIRGDKNAIIRYKKYFKRNQVEAIIKIIPLYKYRKKPLRIDYFSLEPNAIAPNSKKKATVQTVKNILKANSDVIDITDSFNKNKGI